MFTNYNVLKIEIQHGTEMGTLCFLKELDFKFAGTKSVNRKCIQELGNMFGTGKIVTQRVNNENLINLG
jgi:hypothetical protein